MNTETASALPAEMVQKSAGIVEKSAAHVVSDQESYDIATNTLKAIKGMVKEIEATFDPIASKAHAAWKEVLAQKKRHIEPLETADKILRGKATAWFTEQDRIRREAEEKARAEARKKAEDEALARAQFMADAGLPEMAEKIVEAPVKITPVEVAAPAPANNGISYREYWTFEIEDVTLIPREWMIPDEAAIRKHVMANKTANQIPGVRVICEKRAAVR